MIELINGQDSSLELELQQETEEYIREFMNTEKGAFPNKDQYLKDFHGKWPCYHSCQNNCGRDCKDQIIQIISQSINPNCMKIAPILQFSKYLLQPVSKEDRINQKYDLENEKKKIQNSDILQSSNNNILLRPRKCTGKDDQYSCIDMSDNFNEYQCEHLDQYGFLCRNKNIYPQSKDGFVYEWPKNFNLREGVYPQWYYESFFVCIEQIIDRLYVGTQIEYIECTETCMLELTPNLLNLLYKQDGEQISEYKINNLVVTQAHDQKQYKSQVKYNKMQQQYELNKVNFNGITQAQLFQVTIGFLLLISLTNK